MVRNANKNELEFVGLYIVPGEGTVVALRNSNGTQLFDKQGLEWRILDNKRRGIDSRIEEQALLRIQSHDSSGDSNYY